MTDRGRIYVEPRHSESLEACCERQAETITRLQQERASIALILEMFRNAPLSISSVQPILELADRLNGAKQ